jgi:sRNA-binding protein
MRGACDTSQPSMTLEYGFEIGRMTDAETTTPPPRPPAKRPVVRRSPWTPWMATILADWRTRWPAVFTKPTPLAVGISRAIEAVLQAEDKALDGKSMGITLHHWTKQNAYLQAVVRGEMRRNLDGSEAGVPDEAAREYAQKVLTERAARRAEKEQRERERKQALRAAVGAMQS